MIGHARSILTVVVECVRTALGAMFYIPLILQAKRAKGSFARVNEDELVSDKVRQVADYDQVLNSKLAVFYAAGLNQLTNVLPTRGGSLADLAPGPGHFTLCMQQVCGFDKVDGFDLSDGMIATGNKNAHAQGLADSVKFKKGNVTKLPLAAQSYDVVSMTFAAHHLPDHTSLCASVAEMERVVKSAGYLMIMDLARLPNEDLTEKFVRLAGAEYLQQGLDFFYSDFRESMYAAWSIEEMRSAVEQSSGRRWVQMSMQGLETLQILFGLPEGVEEAPRAGLAKFSTGRSILPARLLPEWLLTETLLRSGTRVYIEGQRQLLADAV